MTKNTLYFAPDGNYGSGVGLVVIDPDTLGFPLPEDFWDDIAEEERSRVAEALTGEGGRLIRVMRGLMPESRDALKNYPEYFRGQAEALMDFLEIPYEVAEALLTEED